MSKLIKQLEMVYHSNMDLDTYLRYLHHSIATEISQSNLQYDSTQDVLRSILAFVELKQAECKKRLNESHEGLKIVKKIGRYNNE